MKLKIIKSALCITIFSIYSCTCITMGSTYNNTVTKQINGSNVQIIECDGPVFKPSAKRVYKNKISVRSKNKAKYQIMNKKFDQKSLQLQELYQELKKIEPYWKLDESKYQITDEEFDQKFLQEFYQELEKIEADRKLNEAKYQITNEECEQKFSQELDQELDDLEELAVYLELKGIMQKSFKK